MSSPHVTCDISTATARFLGPGTVRPSLTVAGGKDSFNLGLGLGGGQRFPDPREWMVLLHGSHWSLEWTAGVKSLTDPLSLTLLDFLPSFWPPEMFSTWWSALSSFRTWEHAGSPLTCKVGSSLPRLS